jgi:hypothetical protein
VIRVHQVLCAVAAMVFTLGGALSPESRRLTRCLERSGFPCSRSRRRSGGGSWRIGSSSAHGLGPLLVRDGLLGCAVTVILVGVDFYSLANDKLDVLRMFAAGSLLIAAWVWLSRQQETLAFWLPQEKLTRGASRAVLGADIRDWNTLIWFLTYALLWRSVSGFP